MESNQLSSPNVLHKGQGKDNRNNDQLEPPFDESILGPATIVNGIFEMIDKTLEEKKQQKNLFPIDVFPLAIQQIIKSTNESLNFPIDFIGASILYAVSVAVGNTYRIELMKSFDQNAVLYFAIVGRAGTNKSHPLTFALRPIEESDNLKYQQWQREKQEYDSIVSLSKKEREQQGIAEPKKPVWEQHLVTDFTPEALTEVHKFNKRGIGVYVDELASWFKNFNRYNKGSEEQFWLSNFNSKPIRVNRKTSEPSYIPLPFISVIGTIQPGILNELAKDRTENGFLDRLLFVFPDDLKKTYWCERELNPVIIDNWKSIISNVLQLPIFLDENLNPQPEILRFTPDAKQLLMKWQHKLTDHANKPENAAISGICAKMEQYALRLSLCLEMLLYACGESNKNAVGKEAVQGALKLVEYFKKTALKVHSIIVDTSPLERLAVDKQALYIALPDNFTTSEGVQIAESMGVAERTFKRFLHQRELFKKHSRGEYEKLY